MENNTNKKKQKIIISIFSILGVVLLVLLVLSAIVSIIMIALPEIILNGFVDTINSNILTIFSY